MVDLIVAGCDQEMRVGINRAEATLYYLCPPGPSSIVWHPSRGSRGDGGQGHFPVPLRPARGARNALVIGETHGHYHITERIGAGGMGEVYRATDTKLKRDVAIKVLPDEVAQDPARLARFQREAELLASLNHPHIAAIHGLEEAAGKPLLILELVEGEDLSERLERGAIPGDEATEIARQIAEALEEAHEHGVIHRDLKPANVKLTPEGKVKVLDFGLAKAWDAEDVTGGSRDASRSPTLAYSGTQAGVILGTAAYMSPEQARGKVVDKRADIWAFGVVLYEMLVGDKLFGGETATDIIASVVKEQPDWARLPEETPRVLRHVLRRCLVKDPHKRLRDIGDARLEIELALSGDEDAPEPASAASAGPTAGWRRLAPWVVASLLGATTLGVLLAPRRTPESPVLRFDVPPPEGASFALQVASPGPVRVSPDGRMLTYAAFSPEGEQQLFVQALDEAEARALPGTQGAMYPFWSPDSRHIAFFADRKLKRIEAAGGPPLNLCDARSGRSGSWGPDGLILFAPSGLSPIHQVSDRGGESTAVTAFDEGRKEGSHRYPRLLPDGRSFLYLAVHGEGLAEGYFIVAASLDGGEPKILLRAPVAVEYASGHLFFQRDQTLMAQPFDPDRLELTGEPRPLVDPVAKISLTTHAVFSVSPAGVLAWHAQGGGAVLDHLVWRDRQGEELGRVGEPVFISEMSLSPNGDQAVARILDLGSGQSDLWLYEMTRGLGSRFTFDGSGSRSGVWSPDGESLVFSSDRDGTWDLYRRFLDGSSKDELLYSDDYRMRAFGWHPDGSTLGFEQFSEEGRWDILMLPLSGDRAPRPLPPDAIQRGRRRVLPGRTLGGLSLDGVWRKARLRSALPGSWPEVAGLDR